MIEIKNVTKKYGKTTVIDNISLTVENGSVLGLAGFNGCGKTTLLNVCAGIFKADQGKVLLNGYDAFSNDTTRHTMFYAADTMYLPVGATIKSIAKYYSAYYPQFDFELLNSLCELFALDKNKQIKGFSKGMTRQVGLSVALASRPEILLIDESFDGLDPVKKGIVKKLLLEYINETEASVIISSHNLNEIAEVCDRVAIIKDARVILETAVDDMGDQFRKVLIKSESAITEDLLSNIQHTSVKISDNRAQLIIAGDVSEEISKLKDAGFTVEDEQYLTLEEVFSEETQGKSNDEKIKKIFKKRGGEEK